jgi:hypothetical protein
VIFLGRVLLLQLRICHYGHAGVAVSRLVACGWGRDDSARGYWSLRDAGSLSIFGRTAVSDDR